MPARAPVGRSALLLVAGVVLLLGTLSLARRVFDPLPGDGLRWSASPAGLVAREDSASGTLRRGDRLLAVDRVAVVEPLDLLLLDREARPGQLRSLELERDGVPVLAELPVRRGRAPAAYLLVALSGLLALGAAFALLARGRDDSRVAAAAAIAFAALTLASPAGWLDAADRLTLLADEAGRIAFPVFLCHAVFELSGRSLGRRAAWLYLPALILGALDGLWLAAGSRLDPATAQAASAWLDRGIQVELLLGLGLAVGLALVLARRASSPTRRRRLLAFALGAAFSLAPYAMVMAGPAPNLRSTVLAEAALVPLALLPLGLIGFFPATRLRLRPLIRSGLGLGVGILLALGLALATVEVARGLLPDLGLPAWVAYAAVVLLLGVGLFERVRDALEARLDAWLDRTGYEARRTLLEFGRELAAEPDVDRLADALAERLERAFQAPRVVLYAREGGARLRRLGSSAGDLPAVLSTSHLEGRGDAGGGQPRIARLHEERALELREAGMEYVLPLVSRGERVGAILLGEPRGSRLGRRERSLLLDLAGYVAVALDHARLHAETLRAAGEIRELEQFRLSVIESLGIGLAILDMDGRLIGVNQAFSTLAGLGAGVDGPAQRAHLPVELLDPPAEGRIERRELLGRTLAVSTRLLRRADGSLNGRILVVEDVTEQAAEERDRLRRERLATVGLVAAGVAHEVNTPLAAIASYVQMLIEAVSPEDPRHALLQKVEKQSFRASRMVRNLLDLARPSEQELRSFALEEVVGEALGLLEHALRAAGIRVVTIFPAELPRATGRTSEIEQVVLNLLRNAVDAMPRGGELRLETGSAAGSLWLAVEDQGAGLDEQVRERLFEPFFTTKERGRGHGLGLAVSHRIVEAHHGRIEFSSREGGGTRVTLTLPLGAAAQLSASRDERES